MLRSLSCLFLCLFPFYTLAECLPVTDSSKPLPADNIRISAIEYDRNNIFDLTDKGIFWLHHFANSIHITTTENTLAEDLLFATDDILHMEVLAETERLLRSRRYIREAEITVSQYCPEDNSAVVQVRTWDNWSLLPKIDFSSEGGETEYSIGIADDNLLGSGNQLQLDYAKDSERDGFLLSFSSPNIFGSYWNTLTSYANNSDGESYHFTLDRPFYRLSSPWAFRVDLETRREQITDYLLGDEVNKYHRTLHWFETALGLKLAEQDNNIHRLYLGLTYDDKNFRPRYNTFYDIPDDRNLSSFSLEYQLLQADYRKLFNIHQFNRVEDINFGWQLSLRLGRIQTWLTADDPGWQFKSSVDKIWQLHQNTLLLASFGYQALWLNNINQYLYSSQLQLVQSLTPASSLILLVNAEFGKQLFQDEALYLGGDNGLRAFPLYYQRGDKRLLSTIEYRHYTPWSILRLLDVAFAGFIDSGRSWGAKQQFSSGLDDHILVGVGGGIRLLSRYSSRGMMVHIDLAHPITNNPEVSSLQLRVTAKKHF